MEDNDVPEYVLPGAAGSGLRLHRLVHRRPVGLVRLPAVHRVRSGQRLGNNGRSEYYLARQP